MSLGEEEEDVVKVLTCGHFLRSKCRLPKVGDVPECIQDHACPCAWLSWRRVEMGEGLGLGDVGLMNEMRAFTS